MTGLLPDAIAQKAVETVGIDRLTALHAAIELVRRGGTVSLSGVYGGAASPMPLIQMFDKQINMRMGQANVRRWLDELMPFVCGDEDPLGVEGFATHRRPLDDASRAYEMFQKKQDGAFKVVFRPSPRSVVVTPARLCRQRADRRLGRAWVVAIGADRPTLDRPVAGTADDRSLPGSEWV